MTNRLTINRQLAPFSTQSDQKPASHIFAQLAGFLAIFDLFLPFFVLTIDFSLNCVIIYFPAGDALRVQPYSEGPHGSETGVIFDNRNQQVVSQYQLSNESLILAQNERWRRA